MPEKHQVLLIDAVTWSPAYPENNPLRDVGQWFQRHLTAFDQIEFVVANAESDFNDLIRPNTRGAIISGSPRDAWGDDPINEKLSRFIASCRDHHVPTLGVCYGHQILARALGGKVAPHPKGLEIGNTTIALTPAGASSPLFKGLPRRIDVLSSHADAVHEMPEGCTLLARGEFTPIQGFHWKNLLFGVQFHPEHDPETLRFVWSARRDQWRSQVSFDLDRTLDEMQPTPAGPMILKNFIQHLVL